MFIFQEPFDDTNEQMTDISVDESLLTLLAQRKQRAKRVRIEDYFETVVPMYNVADFRGHFRMNRETVSMLEGQLAALPGLPQHQLRGGRPPVELRKQILITLWKLGK